MSLDFRVVWGDLDLTAYPYSIMWGTDLGHPESVTQVLATLLQDGEYEITDRAGNRTLTLPILTEGVSLDALANAESALVLEARKPLNTLLIDPGDGAAAVTVFDTFAGTVELVRDDDQEIANLRVWNATIQALPFGHDEALTTVTATTPPPPTPVVVSVDDGSSATNWTSGSGATPTVSGGTVRTTAPGTPTAAPTTLTYTDLGAFSLGTGFRYIMVDYSTTNLTTTQTLRVKTTGPGSAWRSVALSAPPPSGPAGPAGGYTRLYFDTTTVNGMTATLFAVEFQVNSMLSTEVLAIDQVLSVNTAGTSVATIQNGSSATGWTATNGSAPSVVSGSVRTTAVGGPIGPSAVSLIRSSATIDVTTSRYLFIDWVPATSLVSGTETLTVVSGGVTYPAALSVVTIAPTTGYNRTYFAVPAAAPTTLTGFTFAFATADAAAILAIDQVSRTNVIPGLGTNRQQTRSITVGGSARTRASLAVLAPVTAETLGATTMLYTRTASTGLQPPLRSFRTGSDTVTADATLVSGSRNALGGTMTFLIPANRFQQATHDLTALLRATTLGTYTVTWATQIRTAADASAPESVVTATGTVSLSFPVANVWTMYDLGTLQLPNVPVAADSTLVVRLTLIASNAVVQIDDAYLFDLDNGALSWVSSTGLTRLEARTADLTLPRPSYWGGYTNLGLATGMTRADWRVVSFGTHFFEPGPMDIFTLTSGTESSSAIVSYYRTWHTHAQSAA